MLFKSFTVKLILATLDSIESLELTYIPELKGNLAILLIAALAW